MCVSVTFRLGKRGTAWMRTRAACLHFAETEFNFRVSEHIKKYHGVSLQQKRSGN